MPIRRACSAVRIETVRFKSTGPGAARRPVSSSGSRRSARPASATITGAFVFFCGVMVGRSIPSESIVFTRRWVYSCGTRSPNAGQGEAARGPLPGNAHQPDLDNGLRP